MPKQKVTELNKKDKQEIPGCLKPGFDVDEANRIIAEGTKSLQKARRYLKKIFAERHKHENK
jgi:hypothetical protein